ncbi:MAG: hypothetical protein QM687_02175 [Ferruginibacter sp.]
MSWFSKMFEKNGKSIKSDATSPEIPEDVFIEKTNTDEAAVPNPDVPAAQHNIHMVYAFLSKDYHQAGYDDALVHPDTSYKIEKIREIQGDLEIVIWKSKTFYEDAIRELDFLIVSRNRLGMVDVVDELKMRKEKADDHYKKVLELQKEVVDQGESHRLIISYKRGFQNGMAAIAMHESDKKKF